MSESDEAMATDIENYYQRMEQKVHAYREGQSRALTLTEKILLAHLSDKSSLCTPEERGKNFVLLHPDRVAMQDATAQMALLQFIQSGKKQVAVPSTVHCDHLILAHMNESHDLRVSNIENKEVFDFLSSASQKYGLGFWGPGSGIIHQVVIENYAFPGGLMIGTDSHTPNAGGLGMAAIGVGGADAVDVMAGLSWELLFPKVVGVKLTGKLGSWCAPKDVILKLLEILTVKGGTNKIIEYFGSGAASISCTGKGTITNMGAELGATTSVFPYDEKMSEYLKATRREGIAQLASQYAHNLKADDEVASNPSEYYDEVIEINLDELEPYIVGPHSPDKARPVSRLPEEAQKESYPPRISACLVGSCTNSSYEDIYKAAAVAKEALSHGLKSKVPFYISPGSMQVYATIKRDGLLDTLESFGGTLLANACGPCIGQWKRDDEASKGPNSIVTSFNRNFRGRNDANPETLSFIASPEMVVAYAITGDLASVPHQLEIQGGDGSSFSLRAPEAPELPEQGFVFDRSGFVEASGSHGDTELEVDPKSQRLQLLKPFNPWDIRDFNRLTLLVKARGKCTTDHISPAGKWLRFRGHLDNISDNMLCGSNNAFYAEIGHTLNQVTDEYEPVSHVAREYKKEKITWCVVGDENYGEGSSREHAAMSPRYLGGAMVLVKSFARIHETNLKKQGMLALTFNKSSDYELIQERDQFGIKNLDGFKPGELLELVVYHASGDESVIEAKHSYNEEQIAWFKAGSALNLIN